MRRRALIGASGARLPAGYQELTYIESTGTQYFFSNLADGPDIKTIQVITSVNWNSVRDRQIEGIQGYKYFGVVNGKYQICQSLSGSTNINATVGRWDSVNVTFDLADRTVFAHVNYQTFFAEISYKPNDGQHFGVFVLGNGEFVWNCKQAELQIIVNDILFEHFVPCRRLYDGAIGMYDLVSQSFFGNSGTGTFIAGNPI